MSQFGNFTSKSQEALQLAQEIVMENNQQAVGVSHLLYVLIGQEEGVVAAILKKMEIDTNLLQAKLKKSYQKIPKLDHQAVLGEISLTQAMRRVLIQSQKEAKNLKDDYISTEHFLLAILVVKSETQQTLNALNVEREIILKNLKEVRGNENITDPDPETKYQILEKYTQNLTDQARQKKLDPVIGRDDEIRRVIQVLSRRIKNNPILIGEAGVGKTAIVEGLAQRIVDGDIPETLKGKEVVTIDLGAIIAGTKFRGEFENRLKALIKEIKDSDGRIIAFIDEFHTIVGAGAIEGSMDASNMLKPALARGDLHCMAATTLREYQKYVEKDPALERRFMPIYVEEPSENDAVAILRGIKEKYEIHHGVRITDSAIVSAVKLSLRYINDRFLPDKAIDLIDEAASGLRLDMESRPQELDKQKREIRRLEIEKRALRKEKDTASKKRLKALEKELANLREKTKEIELRWKTEHDIISQIKDKKNELDEVRAKAAIAERNSDLETVAKLRYGIIPELEKKLKTFETKLNKIGDDRRIIKEEVTEETVTGVVARWTGIPVHRMLEDETRKLAHLEDDIHARMVNQEEAVRAVANAVRRSRAGIGEEKRPIGSFMFMGPTGVGKTELAKALAESMFNDEDAIVRLDMSEYMERHTTSKMIGSPPGYVGHDEGGQLTEKIRRRPYSVVLFDEIEKAHSEVFNVLLQILDDGQLTDSKGRKVNFKNTIIIMTSNVGSEAFSDLARKTGIGFSSKVEETATHDQIKEKMNVALRERFKPEFINRLDEIIIFHALTKVQIKEIVGLQIKIIEKRLASKNIKIKVLQKVHQFISDKGYDPLYGARPLKRVIQDHILNPLSMMIIKGKFKGKAKIQVGLENNKIVFKIL